MAGRVRRVADGNGLCEKREGRDSDQRIAGREHRSGTSSAKREMVDAAQPVESEVLPERERWPPGPEQQVMDLPKVGKASGRGVEAEHPASSIRYTSAWGGG